MRQLIRKGEVIRTSKARGGGRLVEREHTSGVVPSFGLCIVTFECDSRSFTDRITHPCDPDSLYLFDRNIKQIYILYNILNEIMYTVSERQHSNVKSFTRA